MRMTAPVAQRLAALAPVLLATGCDPVINLYGSLFPAWIASLAAGFALTICLRVMFSWTRLEAHLGLLLLVYPSLTFLLTCLVWLVLFRS